VVDTLAREVSATMASQDIREKMLREGFEPVGNGPEQFSKFIREEIPRWDRVVKTAGIKPQ